MRGSSRRPWALPLVPLLAGALATACDDLPDESPLIGPGTAEASASYQPDPAINPADTYYLAEIYQEGSTTIESQTPITDPVTGIVSHQFTARHEPETQRVEGGYDYQGRIIQVLDQTDAIPDPLLVPVNSTRRSRSVQDAITRYDENRQVVPNELVYATGIGDGPSHEQITDGLVLDAEAVDALPELSAAAEPIAAAAGPRASVRRSGPGEIQITNEVPPESFAQGAAAEGGPKPVQARAVRTYAARGQKYVLERMEVTVDREAPGTRMRDRQVSRVRLLRYHENPGQDRARRDGRRGRPVPAQMAPQGGGCIAPTSAGTITVSACEVVPDEPPPDELPPPDPCPQVNTGVTVLFQHGFASGGSTWQRMDDWVRCEFQTGLHIRPSLNWFVSIPQQREQLRPYLPTYGNGTVLVGHSNGGLVARSMAQWAQTNLPGRVRGVVTLDSPNQGAIVAVNMQVLEYVIGTTVFGIQWPAMDVLAWHPVWEDDTPFSFFIDRTNKFDETFTRVGIQTHMPKRWSLARMAWSAASSCMPESPCGERAVRRRIQEEYDRHRHYARFWYRPWQSIPAAASMLTMNSLDAVWNGFTAPFGMPSDGFIHGEGQVYPRALRNRLILNGDSHTGTTRSPLVWFELQRALVDIDLFAIPKRNP